MLCSILCRRNIWESGLRSKGEKIFILCVILNSLTFFFRYEQFFQIGRECCFADYKSNDDGSINVVNNSKNLTANVWTHSDGIAVVSYPDEVPLKAML